MKKYYVLGVGYKLSDLNQAHPYEVWLDLQQSKFPIVMLEGKGFDGVGGSFKPSEILQEKWKEHLEISNTGWLVSLCEDAKKNNNILDCESVIDAYKYIFKEMPILKEIG